MPTRLKQPDLILLHRFQKEGRLDQYMAFIDFLDAARSVFFAQMSLKQAGVEGLKLLPFTQA
jgi:hypothetical protein